MDNSTILSTQGILLTLVSLLGTFFYLHLSDWRKDIIKLQAKWEQNSFNQTEDEKKAVLEVRYELPGLNNFVILLVTGVMTLFILLVTVLSAVLWTFYTGPAAFVSLLTIAGGGFLFLYFTLTLVFLVGGRCTAQKVQRQISEMIERQSPRRA